MNNVKKRRLEQFAENNNVVSEVRSFSDLRFLDEETRYELEHPDVIKADIDKAHNETSMLTDDEIDVRFDSLNAFDWYKIITTHCMHRPVDYDFLRKKEFWSELEAMLIRRYGCVPEQ